MGCTCSFVCCPWLTFPFASPRPHPTPLFAGQWNPLASLKAFSGNPLLKTTAKITLLYYTSVWAVVSTLMVYVARQFQFGPVKVSIRHKFSLSFHRKKSCRALSKRHTHDVHAACVRLREAFVKPLRQETAKQPWFSHPQENTAWQPSVDARTTQAREPNNVICSPVNNRAIQIPRPTSCLLWSRWLGGGGCGGGGIQIGQLLSAFGVCTMFAEGVLVRWMVPQLGEKLTLQIGLLGFAAQCVLLGLAHSEWMVFASMGG